MWVPMFFSSDFFIIYYFFLFCNHFLKINLLSKINFCAKLLTRFFIIYLEIKMIKVSDNGERFLTKIMKWNPS